MAETETQEATEEATHDGAETGQDANTDEAKQEDAYTQADVDRRVSAALKAYQDKRDKESAEQQAQDAKVAAINDGEFKKAWESTQAELDAIRADLATKDYQVEAQGVLVKLGLSHFGDALIPGTKTVDDLIQRAEVFKAGMERGIEDEVKKRLDTGPSKIPGNAPKPQDKAISDMTIPEFQEWKRSKNLK